MIIKNHVMIRNSAQYSEMNVVEKEAAIYLSEEIFGEKVVEEYIIIRKIRYYSKWRDYK